MSSAGKWVLGLLVLLVGAVFIAKTVSNSGGPGTTATDKIQVENAAKKAGPVIAADVACKKTCVEATEVTNEAITTAKLAPGSVTLSKLAFDVPNLNELTTEINARKEAEVSLKAVLADASAATSKATAVVESTTASSLNNEAAARAAADSTLTSSVNQEIADRSSGNTALTSNLNKEITDRTAGDTTVQTNLNDEIAKRVSAVTAMRFELSNPIEIAGPQTLAVNHAEIVNDAVHSDTIKDLTIILADLAPNSVDTTKIINATIKGEDVTQVDGDGLTGLNIKDGTILTNDIGALQVTNPKLGADAVTTDKVLNGTLKGEDVTQVLGQGLTGLNINNGSIDLIDLNGDSVNSSKIVDGSIATADIGAAQVTGGVGGSLASTTITALNVFGDTLTAGQLADNSVGLGELADGAVDTNAIVDGAVTNAKLASGIDGAKLVNGSVATAKLDHTVGTEAVDTGAIRDAAVTNAKLATGVDGAKLSDGSVATLKLDHTSGTEAVDTGALRNGSVTDAKIAAGITGSKLTTGSVDGSKLTDGTVASAKLAAGALSLATADLNCTACIADTDLKADSVIGGSGGAIQDHSIDANDITAHSITANEIALGTITGEGSPVAGVTAGNLALQTVTAANLKDKTVTATQIADHTITALQIGSRTITEAEIALGAITGEGTPVGVATGLIALETITGGNVKDGSLNTQELASNANSLAAAASKPVVIAPPGDAVGDVSLTIASGTHKVLLTASGLATCTNCTTTQIATVTYTLSEGAVGPFTLVGPLATMTLNSSDRSNPLPLSFVASAASGTHNYHLQVASATATGAIVDVTNVTLSAVDLGN